MELRQLRYFVALAEERCHFGQAAVRLRISKPTLSQQIKVLERGLGTPLLERQTRNLSLTPAGEALLEHAREVLAMTDRLEAAVAAARHGERTLDVRIVNGIDHVISGAVERVEADPDFPVQFSMTASIDAEEAVVTGRADAAIVWAPADKHRTLHAETLTAADVCLAVPEDHRLAARDVVPVAELAHEQIALFPRRMAPMTWDTFADHLLPGRRRPGQILEEIAPLSPMLGMLHAAQQGRAVAPFVHAVALSLNLPGLQLRRLDPPLQLSVQMVFRDGQSRELVRLADRLRCAFEPPPAHP